MTSTRSKPVIQVSLHILVNSVDVSNLDLGGGDTTHEQE